MKPDEPSKFSAMNLRALLRLLPVERFRHPPPRVAIVRLEGTISPATSRFRRGRINLQALEASLKRAFETPDLSAVALVVNSPGGSAVQSSLVASRIRALAEEKEVPVVAFVEDVAASGGYWLACAGDEIFADRSSIVGSIGVVFAGFGFAELIARHGVERRLHTAGERKAALDPFVPEDPDDIARLKVTQAEIHEAFTEWVCARRGDRLTGQPDELFSGAFWAGGKALELGLIDGIGDLRSVMRARFGDKVRFITVDEGRSLLRLIMQAAASRPHDMAVGVADAFVDRSLHSIEERALWSRFGL